MEGIEDGLDVRAATIVVRVGRAGSGDSGFRARITQVPDLDEAQEDVSAVASRSEVVAAVTAWLDRFLAAGPQS